MARVGAASTASVVKPLNPACCSTGIPRQGSLMAGFGALS
jgi:hypothetical protein